MIVKESATKIFRKQSLWYHGHHVLINENSYNKDTVSSF